MANFGKFFYGGLSFHRIYSKNGKIEKQVKKDIMLLNDYNYLDSSNLSNKIKYYFSASTWMWPKIKSILFPFTKKPKAELKSSKTFKQIFQINVYSRLSYLRDYLLTSNFEKISNYLVLDKDFFSKINSNNFTFFFDPFETLDRFDSFHNNSDLKRFRLSITNRKSDFMRISNSLLKGVLFKTGDNISYNVDGNYFDWPENPDQFFIEEPYLYPEVYEKYWRNADFGNVDDIINDPDYLQNGVDDSKIYAKDLFFDLNKKVFF